MGYLDFTRPQQNDPVTIAGAVHTGSGEMTGLRHLKENRYTVQYNIDGCDWLYEAAFDEDRRALKLDLATVIGRVELARGLLMIQGEKGRKEAGKLLAQAAASTPKDAMERLDVEAAKAALEER